MNIPRMRTINETCEELKKLDPCSAISPYLIRQLALKNDVTSIRSGNKILINLDSVIEYLNNPKSGNLEKIVELEQPGIKPIAENLKLRTADFVR